MSTSTLTIILAGGKGTRLGPLTQERAKPAVPFAGAYRIIDFPLSNCVNSGLARVLVLTQYKSLSLDRHLDCTWKSLFPRDLNMFLEVIPPQQRVDDKWYRGTADAVYQNIYSIDQARPENVLILAGDHIYAMDYREMLRFHNERQADVTVGVHRVRVAEAARQFGVIQVDDCQRVVGFQEKSAHPKPLPGDHRHALASMGIYVFSAEFLLETLCRNASQPNPGHDFGHHILPGILDSSRVFAHSFRSPEGMATYWKDVGTIDAYFEATQDLLSSDAPLCLHDGRWPIRSSSMPNLGPPLVLSPPHQMRACAVHDSILCAGTTVENADVSRSVLGYKSRVGPGAMLDQSILLGDVEIERDVVLRRVIVDKHSHIPYGMQIGVDPAVDLARGFAVSPGRVTVVPRGFRWHQPRTVAPRTICWQGDRSIDANDAANRTTSPSVAACVAAEQPHESIQGVHSFSPQSGAPYVTPSMTNS